MTNSPNQLKDFSKAKCAFLLRESPETNSVFCTFKNRGYIGINNCGPCCSNFAKARDLETKPETEVLVINSDSDDPVSSEGTCIYSEKTSYILEGRECNIFGKTGFQRAGVCFIWNKPDVIRVCLNIGEKKRWDLKF